MYTNSRTPEDEVILNLVIPFSVNHQHVNIVILSMLA